MGDICIECKQYAKVSCFCNKFLRFCPDCYLYVHKSPQGNHDSLETHKIVQKIDSTEETKLESFKFSKNLTEIQKQLQSNFNVFLQGHSSSVYSLAVTSDDKYVVSGS